MNLHRITFCVFKTHFDIFQEYIFGALLSLFGNFGAEVTRHGEKYQKQVLGFYLNL